MFDNETLVEYLTLFPVNVNMSEVNVCTLNTPFIFDVLSEESKLLFTAHCEDVVLPVCYSKGRFYCTIKGY